MKKMLIDSQWLARKRDGVDHVPGAAHLGPACAFACQRLTLSKPLKTGANLSRRKCRCTQLSLRPVATILGARACRAPSHYEIGRASCRERV